MSPASGISVKVGFLFGLGLLLLVSVVARANPGELDSPGKAFSLTIHNNKITASLDRDPLRKVLTELARHFRFGLDFQETKGNEVISTRLQNATLEEALRKLLVGKDYAFVKSRSSRRESSSDSSLTMLFVLPRDTGKQFQQHSTLEPGLAVGPSEPVTSIADSKDSSNRDESGKVDKLAEELLYSDDPLNREAAAAALSYLDTPEAREVLSQALAEDLDENVRAKAAKALGDSWDPQYFDALREALSNDPDEDVRAIAAEAMGDLGEPEAIPTLQKGLQDPSPYVRERAVEALGDINDPLVISLLRRALVDTNADVRMTAAFELEKLTGVEESSE